MLMTDVCINIILIFGENRVQFSEDSKLVCGIFKRIFYKFATSAGYLYFICQIPQLHAR